MTTDEERERRRRIVMLFDYPGIGPLAAAAVAVNLGTEAKEISPLLDAMVADGELVHLPDGRFARPSPANRQRD